MKENFVFLYKGYVFGVEHEGENYLVRIRQVSGHHIWTVSVTAPPEASRWDLGDASLEAFKNQHDQIDIART